MSTMIWPIYMDRNKSRNEGRKISLEDGFAQEAKDGKTGAPKRKLQSVFLQKLYPAAGFCGGVLTRREKAGKNAIKNVITPF